MASFNSNPKLILNLLRQNLNPTQITTRLRKISRVNSLASKRADHQLLNYAPNFSGAVYGNYPFSGSKKRPIGIHQQWQHVWYWRVHSLNSVEVAASLPGSPGHH